LKIGIWNFEKLLTFHAASKDLVVYPPPPIKKSSHRKKTENPPPTHTKNYPAENAPLPKILPTEYPSPLIYAIVSFRLNF
jgi:hypothetical protein